MQTQTEGEQGVREVVQFYLKPVVDKAATQEAGRPIHKEAEYIRIAIPGDKTLEVDRPVRPPDKQMYPRQYMAFQANKPQDEAVGTILSAWGALGTHTVEDYRFQKVRTVEQLAALSDSNVANLGRGALNHRQMARDFVAAAKSNAPMLRLQAELEEERAQRLALTAALQQQGDKLEAIAADKGVRVAPVRELAAVAAAPAPKKRGRPSKAATT